MIGFFLAMAVLAAMQPRPATSDRALDPGVSQALAQERSSTIRELRYDLTFSISASRSEPVRGRAVVTLTLQSPSRLVFDFVQPRQNVKSVSVGGAAVAADFVNGHIVIPAQATRSGANRVEVEFLAGDEALNRNDEFLYTLFVPSRARLAFPCFDQPDLKGQYRLRLSIPAGWQAVSNAA